MTTLKELEAMPPGVVHLVDRNTVAIDTHALVDRLGLENNLYTRRSAAKPLADKLTEAHFQVQLIGIDDEPDTPEGDVDALPNDASERHL